MDFKELFDLQEKIESRINAYWTYWSIAVFAVAGWLFSGKHEFTSKQLNGIVIGTAVFFFCNLAVLFQATRMVTGIRDEIKSSIEEKSFKSPVFRNVLLDDGMKYRLHITIILHLAVDAVII